MNVRGWLRSASFCLIPLMIGTHAHAQGGDDTAQARTRFREGVKYFDKGQYEAARAAFLQAYALKKHPAVLLNLAQSCVKSGRPLDASRYFQQYLREGAPPPQQKRDAEHGLEQARAKLGHIEVIAPAGAEITIDNGERLGNAPLSEAVDVDPGSHTLRARMTDGTTDTVKVNAAVGQKTTARFNAPQAAAIPPVVATVPSTPPASDPAATAAAPAASEPAAMPPPSASEKQSLLSPPENMMPVYVGAGVGVLGLAGAVVFGVSLSSAKSNAETVDSQIRSEAKTRGLTAKGICTSTDPRAKDFASACATYQDNVDRANTNATLATVSGVVAGAGFVFAAGWYLFAPKKHATTTGFVLVPEAGAGFAGASASGRF